MALCGVGISVFVTVIPNEPLCEISACKADTGTMTEVSAEI